MDLSTTRVYAKSPWSRVDLEPHDFLLYLRKGTCYRIWLTGSGRMRMTWRALGIMFVLRPMEKSCEFWSRYWSLTVLGSAKRQAAALMTNLYVISSRREGQGKHSFAIRSQSLTKDISPNLAILRYIVLLPKYSLHKLSQWSICATSWCSYTDVTFHVGA